MQASMSSEFILIFSIISAIFLTQCYSSPLQLSPEASSSNSESSKIISCSSEQLLETPCRCCKMDCWYSIAKSATHELGHVPGQAGEEEAMATLRLIRACMIQECSNFCQKPRIPFIRPVIIAE